MHLIALTIVSFLGLVILAVTPFALAWWLTDGFNGLFTHPAENPVVVVPGYNPFTHHAGTVVKTRETEAPLSYN